MATPFLENQAILLVATAATFSPALIVKKAREIAMLVCGLLRIDEVVSKEFVSIVCSKGIGIAVNTLKVKRAESFSQLLRSKDKFQNFLTRFEGSPVLIKSRLNYIL